MDDIDAHIIALLGENARQSYADVGAAVGLSASAVKRRVDRLVDRGVIQGFTVVIDPTAVGSTTDAFIELYCRNRTRPLDILRLLEGLPEVVAVYTVTGEADALVHLRTSSTASLEDTIERIRTHEEIERSKSTVVLSRLLDRRSVPSPLAGDGYVSSRP